MLKQNSTSIHDIITQNKKTCSQTQIKRLFQRVTLPSFDLTQFHQHKLKTNSQLFVFFVQELQVWNKKIIQQKNSPFSHSEFNRNSFIFSSLRSACTKNTGQVQQMLKQLSKWFMKNSYNVPQPSILMKVYNPNQQWEVRKTFRSNIPSQINNYKRRFLCASDYKQNALFCQNSLDNNQGSAKLKQPNAQQSSKKLETLWQQNMNVKRSLLKIQNKKMFKFRQQQQFSKVTEDWKLKKNRFSQSVSKNFYQGKFLQTSKHLFNSTKKYRSIRTVQTNRRKDQNDSVQILIKKKRLNTSLGLRKTQLQKQHTRNKSQIKNMGQNQQSKNSFIESLIQQYRIKAQNKQMEISGIHLMSNPFQKKDKLKKQRRKK